MRVVTVLADPGLSGYSLLVEIGIWRAECQSVSFHQQTHCKVDW